MDRTEAERRLQAARAQVESGLANVTERLTTPQGESGGELTLVDQHPADAASETADRELDLTHQRRFESRRERIDAALARVADGTYGRCQTCGAVIPDERLAIIPETPYCVTDAAKEDRELA